MSTYPVPPAQLRQLCAACVRYAEATSHMACVTYNRQADETSRRWYNRLLRRSPQVLKPLEGGDAVWAHLPHLYRAWKALSAIAAVADQDIQVDADTLAWMLEVFAKEHRIHPVRAEVLA